MDKDEMIFRQNLFKENPNIAMVNPNFLTVEDDEEETVIIGVEMKISCKMKDCQAIRAAFEHKINTLLDLYSWPEIKGVFDVKTKEVKVDEL